MRIAKVDSFARNALFLFLALRVGDIVNAAAGMWFVPRYISPEEIGAVLPVTSFATFLSLPIFAFAMAVMKETAWLSASGERGKVKTLLCGVFVAAGAMMAVAVGVSAVALPRFLSAMRVSDASAGLLVVLAAFLGCVAPVYTDALQSLKRFRALAAVEIAGAAVRFIVMLAAMPLRALFGYFAGQAALPVVRIIGSVASLRGELSVRAEPYWNRISARRMALSFVAIAAYQAAPMAASLVEQSVMRTALPSVDSAGYYMVSRFSDFLYLLTFPLLLVMFPYTATAARRNSSTYAFVLKCSAVTLAAAAAMSATYALCGEWLISLLPHGVDYVAYVRYMPLLVGSTALTACQVFATNAEVSAGRFGFLRWLVPLHLLYAVFLWLSAANGLVASIDTVLLLLAGISILRFACAALTLRR